MVREISQISKKGAGRTAFSLFLFSAVLIHFSFSLSGCSVFATRPVQEMSETAAALRAAKEVQADTLSPELYRQSTEFFFKAKREYKFKNFSKAREYLDKSKGYAERAEFEALKQGAVRAENTGANPFTSIDSGTVPPPPEPASTPTPYDYPTPESTPVYLINERNAAAQPSSAPNATVGPGNSPGSAPTPTPASTAPKLQ